MIEQKIKLSVIIITHNEERNIVDCLKSVSWASEIIVVDSQSTDRTVELAKQFTPNVFVIEWKGYGGTKNYALEKASSDWVFWLDADERVTPKLADEIKYIVLENNDDYVGYEVARRAYFLGRWIRHCGWYPGYVIRLFRRTAAKFDDMHVHEKLDISGNIGRLKNDILHYTDETIFHYLEKFNRYTTFAVEDLVEKGEKGYLMGLTIRPLFLFIKMYFIRLGFLDGMHGFILSILSANYVFVKYAKLWERYKNNIPEK